MMEPHLPNHITKQYLFCGGFLPIVEGKNEYLSHDFALNYAFEFNHRKDVLSCLTGKTTLPLCQRLGQQESNLK